jgi:hypothetical protein
MIKFPLRAITNKPKNARINKIKMMLPHSALAALLLSTSNAHLLVVPATTAAIHYLYKFNHFRRATLYYDM